jgi:hypothetical protein
MEAMIAKLKAEVFDLKKKLALASDGKLNFSELAVDLNASPTKELTEHSQMGD